MVFQSFALMPHMTVRENTAFGLELAGVGKKERLQQAELALAQVGLAGWGDSSSSTAGSTRHSPPAAEPRAKRARLG